MTNKETRQIQNVGCSGQPLSWCTMISAYCYSYPVSPQHCISVSPYDQENMAEVTACHFQD